MDKNLRQQNHSEPLNRSLVLPVTFITTSLTYGTAVWGHLKEKERSSEFACTKGFPAPGSLLRHRFQGWGTALLRGSVCRHAEHEGGMYTQQQRAVLSASPGHPQPQAMLIFNAKRIVFYLLIFHIQKFVIFPITFQFIEHMKLPVVHLESVLSCFSSFLSTYNCPSPLSLSKISSFSLHTQYLAKA